MFFKTFDEKYINEIVNMWNESVVPYSIFRSWDVEKFKSLFVRNKYFDDKGFVLLFKDEELIGFGNAIVNDSPNGYITCVVVDKQYQRCGYGTLILKQLEQYLKEKGKTIIRNYYGSSINFEWNVPGTNREHPGAPAVAFNTPYYYLLMANGYNVNGQLDGYYIDLDKYNLPEKVVNREKNNEADGYYITYYDETKHHGFAELFESLNNPGWYNSVKNNLSSSDPKPMLIAEKDGEILGWTGPLFTQKSGRGYLAGIGVNPKVQGRGLGKCLFCELCYRSKMNGAKFMTLFTGSDNLARNIYLYAGMRIVQSFAIMRKELK